MSEEVDPFDDPDGYQPPRPFVNARLQEADSIRKQGLAGKALGVDETLSRVVEAGVQEYEFARPSHGLVSIALRGLPPDVANKLLRAWRGILRDPKKVGHDGEGLARAGRTGLVQETIEGVEPDVDAKGERRVCMLCGGVRWLRMENRGPDAVEVESERINGSRFLACYERGESYLIPCHHCSGGRRKKVEAARRASRGHGRRRTDREYVEGDNL